MRKAIALLAVVVVSLTSGLCLPDGPDAVAPRAAPGVSGNGSFTEDQEGPNSPTCTESRGSRLERPWADAVLLYEDPSDPGTWLPLPTRDDLAEGRAEPVSFENGAVVEVHGKLFDKIVSEDVTYLDDIGIPDAPIFVTFDGVPVAGGTNMTTGNSTHHVAPFGEASNGTFRFDLDIQKPAGLYEVAVHFNSTIYVRLDYRAVVYVSRPADVRMTVSPEAPLVGEEVVVSGDLVDDMGRAIPSVPLQLWFDDILLGPTSDGVYVDDVAVSGTDLAEDFEADGTGGWMAYCAAGDLAGNQWEHGPLGAGPEAHSGSKLWGTDLDGDYQRGALCYLVSPPLDLAAEGSYTLYFWAWWSLAWEDDMAYVLVSTDGGATWDEANSLALTGGSLASGDWTRLEHDLSSYQGSPDVRLAFVFSSAGKTLDVGSDHTYEHRFVVPADTEVGLHRLTARFEGDLMFRGGEATREWRVRRVLHLELEQDMSRKVGQRNEPMALVAWLRDERGQVPRTTIDDIPHGYYVSAYWNQTRVPFMPPPRPGLHGLMDPGTGQVIIEFVVPWDQELGPVNVTFHFRGNDFYAAATSVDVYAVKARTYVNLTAPEDLRVHRAQLVTLRAELRVVPGQSLNDRERGDPVPGEFVRVLWDGTAIGNHRTTSDGSFDVEHLVPSTQPLGQVPLVFYYAGGYPYMEVTEEVDLTVVSETRITLLGRTVNKGEWTWINGTIEDDQGEPVAGALVHIIWKRQPEIGRVLSDVHGAFSLQYYVEYEDRVGNVSVIARFDGDHQYLANETTATWTVRGSTRLERRMANIIRDQEYKLAGKLYGNWGGFRGDGIQGETITLLINGIVVASKTTAYDGTVVFTVDMEPGRFGYGYATLVLEFEGSEFYDGSRSESKVLIAFQGTFTFGSLLVDGRPFNPLLDALRQGETVLGSVVVRDPWDRPLVGTNVSAFHLEGEDRWTLLGSGTTGEEGSWEFNLTLDLPSDGTLVLALGGREPPNEGCPELTLRYIVPPPPTRPPVFRTSGDRTVEAGSALRLEVRAQDDGGWDAERITYRLVSPPEGMVISPDGVITWRPGDGQVGEHDITVWLYDGNSSATSVVKVTVVEAGGDPWRVLTGPAGLLVGILVISLIVANIIVRKGRREETSGTRERKS